MKVKAHIIACNSIATIDFALQASWSGDAIIAQYNGADYHLYADETGDVHDKLMRVVAPSITDSDSVEVSLTKYSEASTHLTAEWPNMSEFPLVDIDHDAMGSTLQWAYGF